MCTPATRHLVMSSNSIVEKEGLKDNYYAHTVNSPLAVPQMEPHNWRTFGYPAPLGLVSFGTGFMCWSIVMLASKSVGSPSLIVVIATFSGGISQMIVGVWEMFLGNTFSATVFTTHGGFNFLCGALYLSQIGFAAAHTVDGVGRQEFHDTIGIFLAIWDLITFIFLLGALRTTTPIVATLASTVCALTCLSLNAFTGNSHLATAGGALGIVASMGAYYGAFSLFRTQHTTFSFIRLHPLCIAHFKV